jgi:hypothetical protein
MSGVWLKRRINRKALTDKPALKPDWEKPAVRNFREGDGNGSYRAILLPEHFQLNAGFMSSSFSF